MLHFVVYGALGWCAEIVWTALCSAYHGVRCDALLPDGRQVLTREERLRLVGHTYLWMFPLYGLGGLLFEPLHEAFRAFPWTLRGALWMLGIFVVEYVAGWALCRVTGRCPWDYSYTRFHVRGLIRVDYAPVWFSFGLLLEQVHDAVARV